jgi:hypothetical protein
MGMNLSNPRWIMDECYPILLVEADGKTIRFFAEQRLLDRGVDAVCFSGDDSLTYDFRHDNGWQVDRFEGCSDDPGLVQLCKEFLQACRDGTFEPHPPRASLSDK